MKKTLYISATCAGLFTLAYLTLLGQLSQQMPPILGWFFEIVLLVGMALGMNSHLPSYAYLIPITFGLAFLFFWVVSLLFSFLKTRGNHRRTGQV
jgi:hypothetical protein